MHTATMMTKMRRIKISLLAVKSQAWLSRIPTAAPVLVTRSTASSTALAEMLRVLVVTTSNLLRVSPSSEVRAKPSVATMNLLASSQTPQLAPALLAALSASVVLCTCGATASPSTMAAFTATTTLLTLDSWR